MALTEERLNALVLVLISSSKMENAIIIIGVDLSGSAVHGASLRLRE